MGLTKVLEKLKRRLFQDTEFRARQIYELGMAQSREVREYLQGFVNDWPYTKEKPKKFSLDIDGGID